MNPDRASLDNLRDIAELPPVSWWPLAPGWWFVIAIVGVVLCMAVVKAWKKWRSNAYRRAATQELRLASNTAEISDILKRAAMCAYPRLDVASLAGPCWCEWLQESSGISVPPDVELALSTGIFSDRGMSDAAEVRTFAENWVRSHGSFDAASHGLGRRC